MRRGTLGLITFGLLAVLFIVAAAFPIGGRLGMVLFGIVVVLVGVWFFRFGPHGDLWDLFAKAGIKPWLGALLFVLLAAAWIAFRLGLLQAVD